MSGVNLKIQPGNLVEVLSEANRLDIVARVINYTGDMISIQDARGQDLPPAYYNQEVKLRIIQGSMNAIILGKICGSTKRFWKIDRLQKTTVSEKREYFRQTVQISAKVQCLQRSLKAPDLPRGARPTTCSVLDVSAGGILLRSSEPFQLGDRLLVSDVRIGQERPFQFHCFVLRVDAEPTRSWQFGCRFEPMEQREEDRLLRAIFAVQRQEIQKRRG